MIALLVICEEHQEAVTYDALSVGLRLHTLGDEMRWMELKAVVAQAVRDPHSALFRALAPDDAGWGRNEMLLADIADTLHWLKWAKTVDGSKNINHPAPIQRPGIEKPERIGTAMSREEMDDWLGWS
ncbi:DUF5361 domain-containing protein [Rhodococcus sp. NPDC058532]|uniref:DUF5361 domain-containing protein n=1 Tax=Rhodococcus sp. NPDC058532 TaxID=3346540 RepID=UPI003651210E